jgi:uncharacterized membrane protein YbhN (UPF0104 family)
VLVGMGVQSRFRNLVTSYFAGQFVSNVLPTTIGGDVLRIARVSRDLKGHRSESVASVVIERLTGWLVLPLISVIGLVVNRGLLPDHGAATAALVINTLALVGLISVLYLASHQKILGRFKEHENWLQFLGSVHFGVTNLRKHPADTRKLVLAAFAFQGTLVLAAFCAARVVGIDEAGITAMMAFIPVVLMVQVLPIGISGLGVRETALVLFLHPLGVDNTQAIALGLALYFLNLSASLVGAPAFAFGGPKGRTKADCADTDVDPGPEAQAVPAA